MNFDFTAAEERATKMTKRELWYAIIDASDAALSLDTVDRANGTEYANQYRDEASVYLQEFNRRLNLK